MYGKTKYDYQSFLAKKFQCLKLNTLRSIKARKCMWKKTIKFCHISKKASQLKFSCQKVSVFESSYLVFLSKEVNVWEIKAWLSIFVTFWKMYPDKNFHAKKFRWLKMNTIFSTNGSKCMGKQIGLSIFVAFSKMDSSYYFHAKNFSVRKWIHFFQSNEGMYVREDYQFLSPFKNCIPTKTSMPKNPIVWNWIFFFQSKERNVCERRLSIFVSF